MSKSQIMFSAIVTASCLADPNDECGRHTVPLAVLFKAAWSEAEYAEAYRGLVELLGANK